MLAIGSMLSSLLLMHPAQETFAEMQLNADTGRVEVSLRLSSLDEQTWLRSVGKQPNPELAVLVQTLRWGSQAELSDWADDAKTRVTLRERYRWIGRQDEGAHVWWYFEYVPRANQPPTHVRCRFFDQTDQEAVMHAHRHAPAVHRFNVISQDGIKSVTTTTKSPLGKIAW